jgi:hypothetical protein
MDPFQRRRVTRLIVTLAAAVIGANALVFLIFFALQALLHWHRPHG